MRNAPGGGPAASPLRRGMDLIDNPLLNEGTAFTEAERDAFGLHGLFSLGVETIDWTRKRFAGTAEGHAR